MFLFMHKKRTTHRSRIFFGILFQKEVRLVLHSVKALALLEARSELLVTVLLLEDDDLIINNSSI